MLRILDSLPSRRPADRGDASPAVTVTELLQAVRQGGSGAVDALVERVYGELKLIARGQMRRQQAGHSLEATGLLHEAWMKMLHHLPDGPVDRQGLFRLAGSCMRSILVDHARFRGRQRRKSEGRRLDLDELLKSYENGIDLLDLDDALCRLAGLDRQQAELVELRFFVGLTVREAAEALGMSARKAAREWDAARLWLARELG